MIRSTVCLLRPRTAAGAPAPPPAAPPRPVLSTHEKAIQINLDATSYGTFAEIGAGQEVARWFFRVGGAAGTVAKSMSAYDMTVSDAIYGPCERYVSRQRLQKMLDHEYELLHARLVARRGDTTRFFVFADTVAARSYRRPGECHGWIGFRFQRRPQAPPADILVHVQLHDRENLQQQEALGILGVNLIYAGLFLADNPEVAIQSLLDNLSRERIEVDLVKFAGPDFAAVDNRLLALQLVAHGLTDAALFTADGEIVQAGEMLYKRPILVARGSFRPVTRTTLDMLECARNAFLHEPAVQGEQAVVLMEMTLKNLAQDGVIEHRDFLDRVDTLAALGRDVLISDYGEFHRLAGYLFRYTRKMIGLVMGVPTLQELFEEKYYTDLAGGILESFGRLFKNDLKLYVYPFQDPLSGRIETAEDLPVAPHLRHLYTYLKERGCIQALRDYVPDCLPIYADEVLARIRAGDHRWESQVPPAVARLIRERRLFGYQD